MSVFVFVAGGRACVDTCICPGDPPGGASRVLSSTGGHAGTEDGVTPH